MSNSKSASPDGATPLDPNESNGLIPDYITTQVELNQLEAENILAATTWAYSKKHSDVLNATFIFELHRRMLKRIWVWAGTARKSDKNVGVSADTITSELAQLLGDVQYWIEHDTYDWDDIGARFHHKLVWIHIFANGNGRHARLMTDILLESNGQARFTWGQNISAERREAEGTLRDRYILALRAADQGDYVALRQFVRT